MNKKLLVIGLPVVLLLVAGFAAKTVLLGGGAHDDAKLAKEPGPVYAMNEAFVVNLADRGEVPHFAKVGVALRFSKLSGSMITPGRGDKPATVADDAQLRDIVISALQRRTSAQLQAPTGREGVKREIITDINKGTDVKIVDVYYTEFAVQ